MNKKKRLGFILIIVGILMFFFKVTLGIGIFIFIIGALSLLNSNENKIEKIKYKGGSYGKK